MCGRPGPWLPAVALGLLPAAGASPALETGPWQLSVGGHLRTMYESYRGLDLGLGPVKDDDWLHQRAQVLWTATRGEALELAAELTWGRMWGKQSPLAPPDQDDPDLLQLYLQARLPLEVAAGTLDLRAGRQTLVYGSGRLLAAREGANQRLAHDALRLSWQRPEGARLDAFVAAPVAVEPGAFDNDSHPADKRFWGLYSVLPLAGKARGTFLDLYYLGLRDEDSIFTAAGEHESRQTVGVRWWNQGQPAILNTELIFQFGEAGDRDIVAGAASLGLGWTFEDLPWRPSLLLRADAISGGDAKGVLHTFHPLFQANNYFNEGGFLSPSNLYNLNPRLSFKPRENLELALGVNFQWRFSADDAVYGPPLQPLAPAAPGGERYLGTAYNAMLEWQCSGSTSLSLGYTYHRAGPSLRVVGGTSVHYFQSSLRWAF